jgi:hypothetical protein
MCADVEQPVLETHSLFQILKKTAAPPEAALLAANELSLRLFVHKGLVPGKSYRYRIREERQSLGVSQFSSYSPSAPPSLRASPPPPSASLIQTKGSLDAPKFSNRIGRSVKVWWLASTSGRTVLYYVLLLSTVEDGNYVEVFRGKELLHIIQDLEPELDYFVRVQSVFSAEDYELSPVTKIHAETRLLTPSTPQVRSLGYSPPPRTAPPSAPDP